VDQGRQDREADAFQLGATNLADPSFRCWVIEGSIQAKSGDDGDRMALLKVREPFDDRVCAVRHHDHLPFWTPALHHADHLPGPVCQRLVWVVAFFVVTL